MHLLFMQSKQETLSDSGENVRRIRMASSAFCRNGKQHKSKGNTWIARLGRCCLLHGRETYSDIKEKYLDIVLDKLVICLNIPDDNNYMGNGLCDLLESVNQWCLALFDL